MSSHTVQPFKLKLRLNFNTFNKKNKQKDGATFRSHLGSDSGTVTVSRKKITLKIEGAK